MSNRRAFDLDMLQEHAELKGGKLLTNKYINSTTMMLWECAKGHKWQATALEVMGKKSVKGRWCPKCGPSETGLNLSLDDID